MLSPPLHFMTKPGRTRCLGSMVALAGILVMQPACQRDEMADGSALAVDRTTRALSGGELLWVNGTYGPGCRNRSGEWSVVVETGAIPDHPGLTVLMNNVTCELTLTELHLTGGTLAVTPAILLTPSFQATPMVFGSPVDFYANAKLSSDLFAADFVLIIVYSDDPRLVTTDNTAVLIPPTVVSHTPLQGAVDVSIATRPTATFSVTMDPATITNLTFTLHQGATPVSASVVYDGVALTATLTPDSALELGLLYEARITTGAEDTRGTPLEVDFVWTFTTALCSQGPVDLGTASSFAVLAASTVTSTGPTSVTGDLGLYPGTSVTGFPPGVIVGALHVANSTALAASTDLSTAYFDAKTRDVCPMALPGEIGGQLLTPGLYWAGSTLAITTGDLTLDALGEVDAVFVFQIGSTLTIGSGRQVKLAGGAHPKNVYWQVGSSATLETGSMSVGTILADQSITLVDSASLNGRAMARVYAVTMISNTIVEPGK